ncbi:pyruvate kinase, cytosolic isozyme [Phoenix dactylifera]|uniref:Pyruvate kinase n=1 Tax=Phoenix dactylifera TaxID=42345 RepID=A0A8B7CN09_PHODC|nr:pyruvate kinase, cytosolic isozyme [Phoenix dactylifera]
MANIDIEGILKELPNDGRVPKTKIVCTLGPASRSVPMLEKLLRAGMNVARFNFSHGSHEYHQETLDNLRIAMQSTRILCAVMLDTKGPEIRTGFLKDGKPIQLKEGQEITISTDYSIKGDENMISMSYKKLPVDLKPGNTILCSDGTITLTVLSCDPDAGTVRCRCQNTAMLGERKNVNLPGIVVDLPTLTEKDKEDILGWGVPNSIDMIALSFVRKGSDLVHVREVLGPHAKRIKLMSKVENQEGVVNFDDILRETDFFMVARGDLGMEIPVEKIFLAQKMMIYKCNLVGKPVVTATQMLESMIKSPRPTRAEATDVANAVLDGTDCVMLSGESAAGAYPELAVKIMARICVEAESSLDYDAIFKEMIRSAPLPMSPLESLASSAVRTANKAKAALIVVLTRGGTTAKLVAKYRPRVPVFSVVVPVLTTDSFDWTVSDESPARLSLVHRGLIPLLAEGSAKATDSESTEVILKAALKCAMQKLLCKPGDSIVVLHRIGVASVIKICIVK